MICVKINRLIITSDKDDPVFPNKVRSKCPAIIFAANRMAKVPGRIIFLIVSIHTINGISIGGVPWGTKWANMWMVLLIHPNSINLIHNGRAKASVIAICLVLVKMYGNNPKKLLKTIIENNEININVLPFIFSEFIKTLNSLCKVNVIFNQRTWNREGINQNIVGINNNPRNVLNQFNDVPKFEAGSKVENRFVIIFSLKKNYLFWFGKI